MIINVHIFARILICCLLTSIATSCVAKDPELRRASYDGALAKVCFAVTDDRGAAVTGATVKAFFDMGVKRGHRNQLVTDSEGCCAAEGRTCGSIRYLAECDGYYQSKGAITYPVAGEEGAVVSGKWQPWGRGYGITLRRRRNPVATELCAGDWVATTMLNAWIGFDLVRHDFVAPVGKGRETDLEVKIDWDRSYGTDHTGMAVSLRFPSVHAGAYYEGKCEGSDFDGAYAANPMGMYEKEFSYAWRPMRNSMGVIVGAEGNRFDCSKVLVGRTRIENDERGNLKSAMYFQISDLEFACDSAGQAKLRFATIYNPTPNDVNLEPKR